MSPAIDDASPGRAGVVYHIPAAQLQTLAQSRVRLALSTIPILLVLGVSILFVSTSLVIVAVLCGFFAYAFITVAQRQRAAAGEAVDLTLALEGDVLSLPSRSPRSIRRVVARPGYLRLLSTEEWVAAYWLDARRGPDAFIDVPLSAIDRAALLDALRASGVPIRHESSIGRIVGMIGMLVLIFGGLTIARVVFRMTVVGLLTTPVGYLAAGAMVVGALVVWRRTR